MLSSCEVESLRGPNLTNASLNVIQFGSVCFCNDCRVLLFCCVTLKSVNSSVCVCSPDSATLPWLSPSCTLSSLAGTSPSSPGLTLTTSPRCTCWPSSCPASSCWDGPSWLCLVSCSDWQRSAGAGRARDTGPQSTRSQLKRILLDTPVMFDVREIKRERLPDRPEVCFLSVRVWTLSPPPSFNRRILHDWHLSDHTYKNKTQTHSQQWCVDPAVVFMTSDLF